VRIAGLSLPTEATVADVWPAAGLTPGTMYLRTGDSSRTDLPDESVDLIEAYSRPRSRPASQQLRLGARRSTSGS